LLAKDLPFLFVLVFDWKKVVVFSPARRV